MERNNNNNPFVRLTIGATLSRTTKLLFQEWPVFVTMGAIVAVPFLFFMMTLSSIQRQILKDVLETVDEDPSAAMMAALASFVSSWQHAAGKLVTEQLFQTFVGILGQSAIAVAVAELYVQRRPSAFSALREAFGMFCNVYCTSFLMGVGLSTLVLLAFGIGFALMATGNEFCQFLVFVLVVVVVVIVVYATVALMLAPSVVMVERKGPIQAIERCWNLANNNRCYIFCTTYCLMMVFTIGKSIINGIIFGGDPKAQFSTFGAVVQTFPMVILFPILAVYVFVFLVVILLTRFSKIAQVLDRCLLEYSCNGRRNEPRRALAGSQDARCGGGDVRGRPVG